MDQIWEFIKYILLGLVQGNRTTTDIFQRSYDYLDSIFNNVVPVRAMNNFQIIVNAASLIAIIIYYRAFLKEILVGSYHTFFKIKMKPINFIIYTGFNRFCSCRNIGSNHKSPELDHYFTNIVWVAICLFITGLLLYYVHKQTPYLTRENLNWKDALFMGTGQAIGLLRH